MLPPIDQLIRSRRKTIGLVITLDGRLIVRAPLRAGQAEIQAAVQRHAAWIVAQQVEMQRRQAALPAPRHFAAGERFPFLGQDYPLELSPATRPPLALQDGRFRLSREALPRARRVFEAWYRQQAQEVITARVGYYTRQHGFPYQRVRIGSARTRWGSCSSRGTLSFTWRLVIAPSEIIDYVVVHELAHTRFRHHQKAFWAQVAAILPDYKHRVTWLKQHGISLSLD